MEDIMGTIFMLLGAFVLFVVGFYLCTAPDRKEQLFKWPKLPKLPEFKSFRRRERTERQSEYTYTVTPEYIASNPSNTISDVLSTKFEDVTTRNRNVCMKCSHIKRINDHQVCCDRDEIGYNDWESYEGASIPTKCNYKDLFDLMDIRHKLDRL